MLTTLESSGQCRCGLADRLDCTRRVWEVNATTHNLRKTMNCGISLFLFGTHSKYRRKTKGNRRTCKTKKEKLLKKKSTQIALYFATYRQENMKANKTNFVKYSQFNPTRI
jgi:hypothetical protein